MYRAAGPMGYRAWSIRRKLLLIFILMTVVPLLLAGSFAIIKSWSEIHSSTVNYATQLTYQQALNINNFIYNYDQNINQIIGTDEFQRDLEKIASSDQNVKNSAEDDLRQYFFYVKNTRNNIEKIEAYSNAFSVSVSNPGLSINSRALRPLADTPYAWSYRTIKGADGTESQYIVITAQVIDKTNAQSLGYFSITFNIREFQSIFSTSSENRYGSLYIVDTSRHVVYTKEGGGAGLISPIMQAVENGKKSQIYGSLNIYAAHQNLLVSYAYISQNGWYLLDLLAYSKLMVEIVNTVTFMLVIVICCILVSLLISLHLSRVIYRPIAVLLGKMKKVENGDFSVQVHEDIGSTFVEFSQLSNGFNAMVKKITKLMQKIREESLKKQEAELHALQMQINPHFLYNTLDSINWMAGAFHADEISRMAVNLAKFFRLGLNKGRETTTVRAEIEHVKCYVEIQKVRYRDKFDIVYEIDEHILDCECIKIILQPIVENSINHGIDPKVGKGEIVLRAAAQGDVICFDIKDNGVGMSREAVRQLSDSLPEGERAGYALHNVDQRIKLHYGGRYGIQIASEEGKGTSVHIIVPLKKGTP